MSEQPPPYNPYDPNAQTPPPPPPPDYGQAPPPPPPAYGQVPPPAYGQPPVYAQPQYGQPTPGYGYGYPQPTDNSGKAVASLVLGIVGLLPVCPLIAPATAIGLGISAKKDIKRSEGRTGGGGMATAGIVLGAIGIVLTIAGGIVFALLIANSTCTSTDNGTGSYSVNCS